MVPQPLAAPDPDVRIAGWIVPLVVVSCLLLAATAIVLYTSFDALPQRIATHYGIDGKADAFHAKSAAIVAMPVVMGVLVSALMVALLYGIACGTRCGGEGERLTLRWGQRRWLAGTLAGLTVAMNLLFAYLALSPVLSPQGMPGGPGVFVGIVLAVVALAFWMAIKMSDAAGGDETPGERWTVGMFYYNPDDPALLVERRVGFGYTPNFARPLGWIVIALAAALALTPFVLIRLG